MKKCNSCNKVKELTEFYKQKRGKDGVRADCKRCFSKYSPKEQMNRKNRRIRVITMYGGKCVLCGERHVQHLTIDHINGNGNIERKTWKSSNAMYLELERRNYPKDNYQVLCWNCNTSKHLYGKSIIQIEKEQQHLTEGFMGEGI